MNTIKSLQGLYVKLGGSSSTVAGLNTIPEMLEAIATILGSETTGITKTPDGIDAIAAAVDGKSVVKLETKNISSNDTYNAASGKAWNKVVVNVQAAENT